MFDLNLACFAIGVKAKQGDTKSNSREAIVNRWVGLMLVDDAIMVMIEDRRLNLLFVTHNWDVF